MTLEEGWSLYRKLSAPTPPAVKRAKRAWAEVRASAQLVNDVLPPVPAEVTRDS